jgi:hypothetical protein
MVRSSIISRRSTVCLCVESLEERIQPSIDVTSAAGGTGKGTLYAAILESCDLPGGKVPPLQTIDLQVGTKTIDLQQALPSLRNEVIIDGNGATINGSKLKGLNNGLIDYAGNCIIRGLRSR